MLRRIVRLLKRRLRLFKSFVLAPSKLELYRKAVKLNLFDYDYYQKRHGKFSSPIAAFSDYLEKSSFANVNPSSKFDTEQYLRTNVDVYHAGSGALQHYLKQGVEEKRRVHNEVSRWVPTNTLHPTEASVQWKQQRLAICLHIFYDDFIDRFARCLVDFPITVDVYIAVKDQAMASRAKKVFQESQSVSKVRVLVAPNKGRNFGPLLVEFSDELKRYDLICHAHSKKSLYSGREQTQWSDYLNQFLLKDLHVVSTMLRLFSENEKLGIYYPTSFWMMPSWVNHWTCNKQIAKQFFADWNLNLSNDFLSYPVGGMFWARPDALYQWLDKDYSYDDFPEEPVPADGTYLHAMERALGLLAEANGYEQFFYYPLSGEFTKDSSYIYSQYQQSSFDLGSLLSNYSIISFDVFDTLLRREHFVADYAKLKLGKILVTKGCVASAVTFIESRNSAEFNIRKNKGFKGDVSIKEVYQELAEIFSWSKAEKKEYLQLEFEFDLEMSIPKREVVNLANELAQQGKSIWLITDTYYTSNQINKMMKRIGVVAPYKLFVSSELSKRKDNGTMWKHIREMLKNEDGDHIHVGDNVRSDAQLCGDFGLSNIHILHPYDKWLAAGFRDVLAGEIDENVVKKWGRLVSNFGSYPFLGE